MLLSLVSVSVLFFNSSGMPPGPLSRLQVTGNTLSLFFLVLLCTFSSVGAVHHMRHGPLAWVSRRDDSKPLTISNQCKEVIYPGIGTQAGTGPAVQGFELTPGQIRQLTVSANWQGRVWGRTNCSFNVDGTAPASSGTGVACGTGDCGGTVNCRGTVRKSILA